MKQFFSKHQTTILFILLVVVGYISYKMFYKPKINQTASTAENAETANFDGELKNTPIL